MYALENAAFHIVMWESSSKKKQIRIISVRSASIYQDCIKLIKLKQVKTFVFLIINKFVEF